MWLRRGMDESENFERRKNNPGNGDQQGTFRALLRHPEECLLVVGLTLGGTVAFYTFTTYLQKFMVNTSRTNIRALGVGLPYALTVAIFGGTETSKDSVLDR